MTSHHTISSITKYTRYHHKAHSNSKIRKKTLIDVARYKSLIEQSYSATKISDDTLAFLFNKCNLGFVTVSKVRINKFYICRQCIYQFDKRSDRAIYT
jgi:hypothetical protein